TPLPPTPQPTPKDLPPPPPAGAVAATVNTQPIPEIAVYRAIVRSEGKNPDVRKEILNFLIDTTLVDQYLVALKVQVEKKDVDERIEQMKKEAADQKEDFEKLLKTLFLTMEELR